MIAPTPGHRRDAIDPELRARQASGLPEQARRNGWVGSPGTDGVTGQICSTDPHHFVWTWPVEGGWGSVGVCELCGAVTTGEREADIRRRFEADLAAERAKHEALRVRVRKLIDYYADPSVVTADGVLMDLRALLDAEGSA